ncbi:MAG: AAA family ATPase [Bacteroidales bacterium]|jgi:predicted ATP-binding protein involved in virulence|nr:AAA family ATPase [Bacteroidales bacterium]
MKIEKLTFLNYRCFDNFQLDFKKGTNLLFGANSSGKTSILQGIKIAMSSFFSGFSDINTRFIGIAPNDFTTETDSDTEYLERPVSLEYDFTEFRNLKLTRSGRKNRTSISGIKEMRDASKKLYQQLAIEDNGSIALPLFAAFSTEDIHSSRKLDKTIFAKYIQPRSFGYYECLQGDGFFNYWIYRLLVLTEGQKSLSEINIVKEALSKALGPQGCNIIDGISIRPLKKQVFFKYIDGREIEASNLSDGYKRLVNIVIDLSIRCCLLNGKRYGTECCELTSGIVLIDEIDQHLHPELQTLVMKALRTTFPELQFIITSHAPMVMSSVMTNQENKVILLQYQDKTYTSTPISTYGLDATTILESYMGNLARVAEVHNKLKALFELIDTDQYTEARNALNELKNEFGDSLPEISQAQSMLDFNLDSND